MSFALPLDPAQAQEGTLVATLWARRMIRDLEEGRSAIHPRRGSQQARALGLKDEQVKAEIVSLGTAWSLVSRHTSFVAVEERATPTQGVAQLRKIPVAITKGWHGVGVVGGPGLILGRSPASMRLLLSAPALGPDDTQSGLASALGGFTEDVRFGAPRAAAAAPRSSRLMKLFTRSASVQRPTSSASTRPLDHLVALQGADGSWKLTRELAQALGWPDLKRLKKALGRPLTSQADEKAAATALALTWLERDCADTRDEWRLLADKGRDWLGRTPEGAESWLTLAAEALALP